MSSLHDIVRGFPKAELHVHLEGCVGPEQMFALAERNGLSAPFADLDDARASYRVDDFERFGDAFARAASVFRTRADFRDVTARYLAHAVEDGIRHAEIMVDVSSHLARGVAAEDLFGGVGDAIDDAAAAHGTSAGVIVSFPREDGPDTAHATLAASLPWRERIVAVGVDSAETGHSLPPFAAVFARARSRGLRCVAHAGCVGPVRDVRDAHDVLQVDRLDHANRCYDDPDLAARLASRGAVATVCPRAEVALGAVPGSAHHPLGRMLADGWRPVIGSDDPAWFGSLTSNYLAAARWCALGPEDLASVARTSFGASTLAPDVIARHLDAVDDALERVRR